MIKPIHVVYVDPDQDVWRVSGENPSQLFGTFSTKERAIENARDLAKQKHGQMIVRSKTQALEFAEDFASVER